MSINFRTTPAGLSEHVFERKGCPIHYWTGGAAGRPVVALLHGGSLDHRMFNAQVPALLPHYRVFLWDARGHGKSQPMGAEFNPPEAVADLLAIFDHEGIEQAVLVGQSLGGMIAQQVYYNHCERVSGLVMIGAIPISKRYARWEVALMHLSLAFFWIIPHPILHRLISTFASFRRSTRRYIRAAMRQMPRRNFIEFWESVVESITTRGLPGKTIDVPLLLTCGNYDIAGTVQRDTKWWAIAEPDAEYITIPKAGHNANQDNPEFFNRLLLEFLETICSVETVP